MERGTRTLDRIVRGILWFDCVACFGLGYGLMLIPPPDAPLILMDIGMVFAVIGFGLGLAIAGEMLARVGGR